MSLTRRKGNADAPLHSPSTSEEEPTADSAPDDEDDEKIKQQPVISKLRKRHLAVFLGVIVAVFVSYRYLPKLLFLKIFTLLPAAVCFWRAIEPNKERPLSQRILPLALVTTTVSAQLPVFLGAAFASIGILAFGLVSRPPSSTAAAAASEESSSQSTSKPTSVTQHKPESAIPVAMSVILMIAVLLVDNFFCWVVAANFKAGQSPKTSPDPLQDNGQLIMQWLVSDLSKREVVGLRRLWNVQWSLMACLFASLVCVEVFPRAIEGQNRRTLFRISQRAVLTLALARAARVVSYALTVMPSQSKHCYIRRFPVPPPEDWIEWIMVGLRPMTHGGCNDLIVSGHATVISVLTCISASVGTDPLFQASIWSFVFLDFCVEIYEGFHYSVDMFLGTVLVCLVWRVMAPVEEISSHESSQAAIPPPSRQSIKELPRTTIGLYCLPVIGAYAELTILPRWTVIPAIVLYAAVAVGCVVASLRCKAKPSLQAAYQHVAQHTLLCLLFFALGVYL